MKIKKYEVKLFLFTLIKKVLEMKIYFTTMIIYYEYVILGRKKYETFIKLPID